MFTKNKRSVMLLHANLGPGREQVPVALVAIGGKCTLVPNYTVCTLIFHPFSPCPVIAMLVGSIGWSKNPGNTVSKGAEAGWFAYGGSTLIAVFPSRAVSGVRFDDDLIQTSEKSMETIVRVGNRIAVVQ